MRRSLCVLSFALLCACAGTEDGSSAPEPVAREAVAREPVAPPELDLAALMDRAHFAFRPSGDVLAGAHQTYRSEVRGGQLSVAPRAGDVAGAPLALETRAIARGSLGLGGETRPRVGDDGEVVLPRGSVVEELENTSDGVEQRWRFEARPAGAGPLRVEIAAEGLAFVGATPGGLHFREPGAEIGVRYSHATWVDARGARTPIEARWERDRIVLEVPGEIVDAASYPAVLDPTIGPERALDAPVAATPADGAAPHVACTTTTCLVVWRDTRGSSTPIFGARVSSAGAVLDPFGIPLWTYDSYPDVATDGTRFLVAWANFSLSGVQALRVATDGTILDAAPITIGAGTSGFTGAVGVAGSGAGWLVTLGAGGIRGARVSSAGAVLDASPFAISDSWSSGAFNVAGDGSGWMVAYGGSRGAGPAVLVSRVSGAGADLDPVDVVVRDPPTNDASSPAIGFSGTVFFVSWWENRSGAVGVYGSRVSTAGVVLDPAGTLIRAGGNWSAVGSDGSSFLVAYDEAGDARATRVSSAGAVLDATGLTVGNAAGTQQDVDVAAVGSTFLVVWDDNRTSGWNGIYANRVISGTGAVLDGATGFVVSGQSNTEREVAIATSGSGSFAVWKDDRAAERGIYGVRLDATGAPIGSTILVSPGSRNAKLPAVAWNGTNYFVTWVDERAMTFQLDIYGARVSAAGALLDASGIAIATNTAYETEPAVASNGTDWLVVWNDARAGSPLVYGSRVSAAGVPLDGLGVRVSTTGGAHPAIAFDGTEYLVAWDRNPITARRVSAAGAPIGADFAIETATPGAASSVPAIAPRSGGGFGVVWYETRGTNAGVYGNVVAAGGLVPDLVDDPIALQPATGAYANPAIAFTGSTYVVAFQRGGTDSAILGARMTLSGEAADATPFEVTRVVGLEQLPALASDGGDRAIVAYQRQSPTDRAFARVIDLGSATGAACAGASDCASGLCVDGRCCGSACGAGAADCQACSVAAGGTSDGTCTPLAAAIAPTRTCRAAAGGCDVAETCSASSTSCPADALAGAGTECRASAGACDVAEACNGASAACPADVVVAAGTSCRPGVGDCDVPESCDGASPACPSDVVIAAGTTCRAAAGDCDLAESCDGASGVCPVDLVASAGTTCRAAAGACDVAEACSGASAACPADALASAATECRAAAGTCDVAETCSGSSAACPADLLIAAGTECRGAAGACDVAETCSGSSAACPGDVLASAGTECRAAAGDCDVAEACTGAVAACPADAFVAAGTECRATAGDCDVAEACTGSAAACPGDTLLAAGTQCRASAGDCDASESCTGADASCPTDVLLAAGTECRAASGACDVAEACDGAAAACPADALAAAGTECRAPSGACDVAEACDGASDACPADALASDGTTCDDALTCTGSGSCAAGLCVTAPLDCDDGDACTDDACDEASGCTHTASSACLDAGTGDDAGVGDDAGLLDDGGVADDGGADRDGGPGGDAGARIDAAASDGGTTAAPSPGCGCRAAAPREPGGLAIALGALALVAWRRRRAAR